MLAEWQAVLTRLRDSVEEHSFNAWIAPIRCRSEEDGGFRLEVGSTFTREWISRSLLGQIRSAFAAELGRDPALRLVVVEIAEEAAAEVPVPAAVRQEPRRKNVVLPTRPVRIGRLAEHYTFDRFIVGPSNELAYRAACAVGEGSGRGFNPLFVWGGVGLGKTHLISALAHRFVEAGKRSGIALLSAEEFMNQMIEALRLDRMRAFRERFRDLDLLIVDDVEFLAGKERTQAEFFHTFDALFAAGKQVVLTSDKPPQAIPDLTQRLRSRFEGGLNADVRPPTDEMRVAIVQRKAADRDVELAPSVVRLIVDRSGPSVRELEGALTRILAWRDLTERTLDEVAVARLLEPTTRPPRPVTAGQVLASVCRYYRVAIDDLRAQGRERSIAEARQIAMFLCRHLAGMPYAAIGAALGGRDHSTVIYAVRSVETRRGRDTRLDLTLSALERTVREAACRDAA